MEERGETLDTAPGVTIRCTWLDFVLGTPPHPYPPNLKHLSALQLSQLLPAAILAYPYHVSPVPRRAARPLWELLGFP